MSELVNPESFSIEKLESLAYQKIKIINFERQQVSMIEDLIAKKKREEKSQKPEPSKE